MALARASFGLGSVAAGWGFPAGYAPSPFSGPAALREKFYPAKYGGIPSYISSTIPDNADWIPGIAAISSVDLPGGTFLAPADSGGHYATDNNHVIIVWDGSGHLVSQFDVGGKGGGPQFASSLDDAYNPASPSFGLDIQFPGGGFQRFDPGMATNVAGRMANLHESQATAEARARAAAAKLKLSVTPLSVTAPPPAPPKSFATPPGMKLPVNTPPPPGTNEPSQTTPTMQVPDLQPSATTETPVTVPTIASVAAANAAPQTAGVSGVAALLIGGGLLFAMTRKKR